MIHNGGLVCLAIAVAARARFIRVCILTGARVWDTGEFDHGCAAELLRKRKELAADGIHIFADVDKKHSVPFPGIDLQTHIQWTEFYGADALIVSGRFTGNAPDVEKVREAKQLATRPVLIGSGCNAENAAAFLRYADGIIVGTGLKSGWSDGKCRGRESRSRADGAGARRTRGGRGARDLRNSTVFDSERRFVCCDFLPV